MTKWYVIEDRKRIAEIIRGVVSEGLEITVLMGDPAESFTSRILRMEEQGESGAGRIILERVTPEEGNRRIETSPEVRVTCAVGRRALQFTTRCPSLSPGDARSPGIPLELPAALKIRDLRREERIVPDMPEFVSVEFVLGETPEGPQVWRLNVLDCSRHGLALLVTEIDIDLLKRLKPGDVIKDMTFYAKWAIIQVDATVRHITRIRRGEHEGQYVLGIESSEPYSCINNTA